jgi:hypothetical protein
MLRWGLRRSVLMCHAAAVAGVCCICCYGAWAKFGAGLRRLVTDCVSCVCMPHACARCVRAVVCVLLGFGGKRLLLAVAELY